MRRSQPAQTTAAAIALLLFGALGAEAYGLHSCPLHHHRTGSPAGHPVVDARTDAPADDAALPVCVCVGSCHGAAASPVPALGAAHVLPATPAVVLGVQATQRAPARDRGAYFLPYPNGPPLG